MVPCEFQASQSYIIRPCLKTKQKPKGTTSPGTGVTPALGKAPALQLTVHAYHESHKDWSSGQEGQLLVAFFFFSFDRHWGLPLCP